VTAAVPITCAVLNGR